MKCLRSYSTYLCTADCNIALSACALHVRWQPRHHCQHTDSSALRFIFSSSEHAVVLDIPLLARADRS
jgi:hypothetical protein